MFSRIRSHVLAFALVAFALGVVEHAAHASIVERVVAVVGEKPILLSDLRKRARPYLLRIAASSQSPAQVAAAESEALREVLNRLIDERLIEQAADKARITVTTDDVDGGLRNVAAQAKVSKEDLIAEAKRQGLTEQDYREEIRRQLLEGRLIQLRVRGRVRVSEEDGKAAYGRWVREMATESTVDLRIIALRIVPGSPSQSAEARSEFAMQLIQRVRDGENFCTLSEKYSDDSETKTTCGSRGPKPMNALAPPLQELVKSMRAGDVEKFNYGNEAILVVQMAGPNKVPAYDEMKDTMMERAYGEALERQRKIWLGELRRGVYLDVRM